MEFVYLAVAGVLLLAGAGLALIPMFPALIFMGIVAGTYGVLTNFTKLSPTETTILLSLSVIGLVIDQLAGVLGAKLGGATKKAAVWGFLAMLVGGLTGGPVLAFVGLFLGIFVAEMTQFRSHAEALRAARGGLLGAAVGYVTTIFLSAFFFGLFLVFTLRS